MNIIYLVAVLLSIAVMVLGFLVWFFKNKLTKAVIQRDENANLASRILSQKKSSEIVLGQVTEQLVPFLEQFKHDPRKANFLGQPIDYIIFDDDEIVFVEVKSGNSRLTAKQRKIKKQIKDGKVVWEEIAIKPKNKNGHNTSTVRGKI